MERPEEDNLDLTSLDRLLWALSFAGHCILLAVLFRFRRAASFPVFTTQISMNIVRTVALYLTLRLGSPEDYFYTYWTLAIVDTVLQLAVAYELSTHVFQPLGAWAGDLRRSFVTLASASILIAVGLTWLAAPPTQTLRLAVVIRGNLFSSALMSELFVAMIALSVRMGLPWRTHVARLAQGFGIISIFGIVSDAAHGFLGSWSYKTLSHLQIFVYLFCLEYWIITLAMKEPVPLRLPEELHMELRAMQKRAALMLESLRAMGSAP